MTEDYCKQFIDRYGFHADLSLSDGLLEKFLQAMKVGFRSRQPVSDLAMIPLIFRGDKPDTAGRSVIVIDVGGTNTRAALICFDENRLPQIKEFYRSPTPGTSTDIPISIEEFFRGIAETARPVLSKADHIGICFSYANMTLPDGDAVITAGGKQIMVEGFIGSTIGKGLRRAMKELGLPCDHHIRIINDTAAVLLGGMALDSDQEYGGYVGLVLGTGLNQAYIEPERSFLMDWSEYGQSGVDTISKAWPADPVNGEKLLSGATVVVNQECGGFRGIDLNEIDRDFIGATYDPHIDWIEKLVSGYYFGGLVLHALKAAASEGTGLSPHASRRILDSPTLETQEISIFLESGGRKGGLAEILGSEEADIRFGLELIDSIMERTAFYVSVCIAGALVRGERKQGRPTCIMVEGSLYEKLPGFRQKLETLLARLLDEVSGLMPQEADYRFVTGQNTTILGTALAGLW